MPPASLIQSTTSQNLSEKLWSTLPVDILREVVTTTAVLYPVAAGHLRRVCSDFNRWILPIILKHVVLETTSDALRYASTVHAWEDKPTAPVPDNPWGVPLAKAPAKPKGDRFPHSAMCARSLALVTPARLPSVEDALAGVDTLADINSLAISQGNISAHRFWLRRKRVRPRRIMLLHHGGPDHVDMTDELLSRATHLYANHPEDLVKSPGYDVRDWAFSDCLRYVAIHVKLANMNQRQRESVADALRYILEIFSSVEHIVLTVMPNLKATPLDGCRPRRIRSLTRSARVGAKEAGAIDAAAIQPITYWDSIYPELSVDRRSTGIRKDLHRESRFTPMLYPFDARREWEAEMDVWTRARLWKQAESGALVGPELTKLGDEQARAWVEYSTTPTSRRRRVGGVAWPWLTDATKDGGVVKKLAEQANSPWTPVEAPWSMMD
ncbi:hypothetical protein HDZ31DRAFT_66829 [Schizophyllum fasciatum]